jgi:hypothetical protein
MRPFFSSIPGAIVLLHGGDHREETLQSLAQVLPTLRQHGYCLESLCR